MIRELPLQLMLTGRFFPIKSKSAIPSKAEDADIQAYLASRLQNEPLLSKEMKQEIVETISKGADGM